MVSKNKQTRYDDDDRPVDMVQKNVNNLICERGGKWANLIK